MKVTIKARRINLFFSIIGICLVIICLILIPVINEHNYTLFTIYVIVPIVFISSAIGILFYINRRLEIINDKIIFYSCLGKSYEFYLFQVKAHIVERVCSERSMPGRVVLKINDKKITIPESYVMYDYLIKFLKSNNCQIESSTTIW